MDHKCDDTDPLGRNARARRYKDVKFLLHLLVKRMYNRPKVPITACIREGATNVAKPGVPNCLVASRVAVVVRSDALELLKVYVACSAHNPPKIRR